MKKYLVQMEESRCFCIDVEAETIEEARRIAKEDYQEYRQYEESVNVEVSHSIEIVPIDET